MRINTGEAEDALKLEHFAGTKTNQRDTLLYVYGKNKTDEKARKRCIYTRSRAFKNGGERGIRTPGTFRLNGFQDRRNRPLCHLSEC